MKKTQLIMLVFNLTFITIMLFLNLVLLLLKIDWNIILYVNIPDLLIYIININMIFLNFRKEEKIEPIIEKKVNLQEKHEKQEKPFKLESNESFLREWEKKVSHTKKDKNGNDIF